MNPRVKPHHLTRPGSCLPRSFWAKLEETAFSESQTWVSQVALVGKKPPAKAGDMRLVFNQWRRKWHPTPVFSPGESHGQRSLACYSPWGHKELDTTERFRTQSQTYPRDDGMTGLPPTPDAGPHVPERQSCRWTLRPPHLQAETSADMDP